LLWGFFVLGGTRKDFCLSCVNRRALSQSLRIMSITIFYFFWGHRNLTQNTRESPRETTTDGTDYTDVEKTTKSEEVLPIESDEPRETIGLSNLLPPPALSVISVSSVVILIRRNFRQLRREQTFNHGFHGCRPESGKRDIEIRFFRGKDGLPASDLARVLGFIVCPRELVVHCHCRNVSRRMSPEPQHQESPKGSARFSPISSVKSLSRNNFKAWRPLWSPVCVFRAGHSLFGFAQCS